ncbi:MAG: Cu(I)/Ag(I) efflux system membrane fusion protein [Flavobacteriales bacterium]|jgi:Cu(I)/Ag(I) efflux system membrane fusion protein
MKKYIIYIAVLVLGLALGWVIFGNNSNEKQSSDATLEEIWTCSMHPQIRQPEPGDCPLCGMDLIPLEANSNSNPLVFEMTEDAIKIANIQTTVIGSGSTDTVGLKLSGKIKVDETNSASIVTHISGRIEKLYISFTGEKVVKGQKIASIYSPSLISAQKELLEAYKVKEVNPKLYEATVNKLKFWKITEEQIESIISSETILESFNIYAGFSGVVLSKKVSVGDYLKEGEVLFDIQNLNQLWAVFDVYETDLGKINTGTKISFTASAIPSKVFTSAISFVDPIINPATRTATVRTTISNTDNLLKPEMFLEGAIQSTNDNNELIVVPKTAVLWTGKKSVVYVKLPELTAPSFEFREVTLGESIGLNYIVLEGVDMGDEVVTNGAFVIDASAQLNNQSSMMNRNLLNTTTVSTKELPDYTSSAPVKFKEQLNKVIVNYLLLKNALVIEDSNVAIESANLILKSIAKVEMNLVKGDAHVFWMQESKEISTLTDEIILGESIDDQRKVFLDLSATMVDLIKVFGVNDQTYYVQFCPMAFDDGGFWLSSDKKILNPYFGDKMLNCGSVELTIDKEFKNKKIEVPVNNVPMSGHNH